MSTIEIGNKYTSPSLLCELVRRLSILPCKDCECTDEKYFANSFTISWGLVIPVLLAYVISGDYFLIIIIIISFWFRMYSIIHCFIIVCYLMLWRTTNMHIVASIGKKYIPYSESPASYNTATKCDQQTWKSATSIFNYPYKILQQSWTLWFAPFLTDQFAGINKNTFMHNPTTYGNYHTL